MEEVAKGKNQREVAVITYNIFFEEIWDFYLKFVDWKTTDLTKK